MAVGENMKDLLAKKGMTIKELSLITGIPLNTLYSITKRNSKRVQRDNLVKIADALGVSVNYLQFGDIVAEHNEYTRARAKEIATERSQERIVKAIQEAGITENLDDVHEKHEISIMQNTKNLNIDLQNLIDAYERGEQISLNGEPLSKHQAQLVIEALKAPATYIKISSFENQDDTP